MFSNIEILLGSTSTYVPCKMTNVVDWNNRLFKIYRIWWLSCNIQDSTRIGQTIFLANKEWYLQTLRGQTLYAPFELQVSHQHQAVEPIHFKNQVFKKSKICSINCIRINEFIAFKTTYVQLYQTYCDQNNCLTLNNLIFLNYLTLLTI